MVIFSGLMTGGMIVMVFAEALVGANYSRLIVITFFLAMNLFMLALVLLLVRTSAGLQATALETVSSLMLLLPPRSQGYVVWVTKDC